MDKNKYLKTIICKGNMVNIGLDDCSQCYFFEFINDKGKLQQVCCSTYTNYMQEVNSYFETPKEKHDRIIAGIMEEIANIGKE